MKNDIHDSLKGHKALDDVILNSKPKRNHRSPLSICPFRGVSQNGQYGW